ncbi:MAG: mechanosensitive ion channel [Ruminococcus sp.]|nr:mechanosensitive ion channel [Ruminococcus sp.]
MEETLTEAPEIISEAEQVMDAVASGNVDKSVLLDFGQALLNFLPTVIAAVLIYIAGRIIAGILLRLIDKAMGRTHMDRTAQGFLNSVIEIIIKCFVIIIALSVLGIPMTSIITAVGAAGVAVGLALQNSLSNVAGGFIILLTSPFGKGDYIVTNGIEGTVEDIKIMSTKLITGDNKVVYIPNGMVSGSTITNFSRQGSRRVEVKVCVSYEQDFREAVSAIEEVISEHPMIHKDNAPLVRVCALAESSVDILVRVWTDTDNYWTVYYDLLEQIKTKFDDMGIAIPYQKLDVNLKK